MRTIRVNEWKSIVCLDCVISIEQAVYDSADLGIVVMYRQQLVAWFNEGTVVR